MLHIGRESSFCSEVVLPTAWKGPKKTLSDCFVSVCLPTCLHVPSCLALPPHHLNLPHILEAPSLPDAVTFPHVGCVASKVYFGDATVHSTSSHYTASHYTVSHRRHSKENQHTTHYPTRGYPTRHHPIIPTESIPQDTIPQTGIPQTGIPQQIITQETIPQETTPPPTTHHPPPNTMAEPPVKQEARNRVKADPDSSDQGGGSDHIDQLMSSSSVLKLEGMHKSSSICDRYLTYTSRCPGRCPPS